MLSLRSGLRGIQRQVKNLDFKSVRNLLINSRLDHFDLETTFSHHPINYSSISLFNPKKSVADENILSNDRSINFHMRSMTTVPVEESDQVTSTTPANTCMPQFIKVKRLDKTAKHIMNILDKEAVDKMKSERDIPNVESGYVVEIKMEAPENKGRITTIKGLVIGRRNSGISTAIRVRRLESGVVTESLIPIYTPNIRSIKVLEKRSVRRAKLYYTREKPFNIAMRELAQRTAKKKEMITRGKRTNKQSQKK
ncbi:hypothetical protein ZOSMA_65G00440 [Zostera marina]|uniref:50S ribosomal protein L19 n=1 Tax=Zostera marina TaxID=29655 RepID=A0A0K9NUI7_ZOSMR|nr:hypothetical protein ZOSMA_65G00440 [Zostera marina]